MNDYICKCSGINTLLADNNEEKNIEIHYFYQWYDNKLQLQIGFYSHDLPDCRYLIE